MNSTRNVSVIFLSIFTFFILYSPAAFASDKSNAAKKIPNFSRPLLTTYPDIENEAVLTHRFREKNGSAGVQNRIFAEFEYAVNDQMAIELEVPYTFKNPDNQESENNLDNVEFEVKIANHSFADSNVVLAYGFGVAAPTGDDNKGIGSDDTWFFEPYYVVGYDMGDTELLLDAEFEFPLNEQVQDQVGIEFESHFSLLQRLPHDMKAMLEFELETPVSGDGQGKTIVNVQPGFKFEPIHDVEFAVGVGFPITDNKEYDVQVLTGIFIEFD